MKRKIMLELTEGEAGTVMQVLGSVAGKKEGPAGVCHAVFERIQAAGGTHSAHRTRHMWEGIYFYGWDGTL